jgi:hypothetical protein
MRSEVSENSPEQKKIAARMWSTLRHIPEDGNIYISSRITESAKFRRYSFKYPTKSRQSKGALQGMCGECALRIAV